MGVGVFGVLALGHYLTLAGRPIPWDPPLRLPAAWLSDGIPWLRGLANWYRAAGPATVFLAPAAALGADVLARRAWPAGLALAGVVVIDALAFADAPWPRPTYDPRPPAELVDVPGDGPAALLPFDRGMRRWPERVPRAYQRWQPWLDRPITEHYEGPDALADDPALAWADHVCQGRRHRPDHWRPDALPPPEPTPAAARDAVDRLAERGLDVIVVIKPRAAAPDACVATLGAWLGPPAGDGEVVAWWSVQSLPKPMP